MYAIRYNFAPDAKRWELGQPLGWVITADGDWPFFTSEERNEIVNEIRAEEMRRLERC